MTYEKIIPRARLGFIIPTSNRMVEPQVQRYMPQGVVPHFTRIGMTNKHKAPLEQQMPKMAAAAEALSESKMNAIILQCTGTSMSGGLDTEKVVIEAMEKASGVPCSTAASSLTSAFRALNAKKLVFVSETKQPDHEHKLKYLRACARPATTSSRTRPWVWRAAMNIAPCRRSSGSILRWH